MRLDGKSKRTSFYRRERERAVGMMLDVISGDEVEEVMKGAGSESHHLNEERIDLPFSCTCS